MRNKTNNMQEIFKQLFAKYNLTDKQIEEFSAGFAFVAFIKLLEVTESRFLPEETTAAKAALEHDDLQKLSDLILVKYSPKEFNQILQEFILPLFEDFRRQVIA